MADLADIAQELEEIQREEALYRVLGPHQQTKIPDPHPPTGEAEKEND